MEQTTISIIAIVLSLISLGWQLFSWNKQHEQTRLKDNLSLLIGLNMYLAEMPELYRFHGITRGMLKEHEVTEKELAYLVSNFISGQIYYETTENDPTQPFPEDDYRSQMCQTKAVRKAWPLVKLMLDNTAYRQKLDLTIAKYGGPIVTEQKTTLDV